MTETGYQYPEFCDHEVTHLVDEDLDIHSCDICGALVTFKWTLVDPTGKTWTTKYATRCVVIGR